jgi:predicted metal-binding membrane protein
MGVFLRSAYLRLRPGLYTLPLSMLVTLIGVTIAAWALTLYQAISMDVPMGVAMRGSMAAEGMAGMAIITVQSATKTASPSKDQSAPDMPFK